ncbi:hypothetical protein GM539_13940, partial [Streptococcus pneumoniae]|nr:hypothetical protein [Streptococcus pneumoniae]
MYKLSTAIFEIILNSELDSSGACKVSNDTAFEEEMINKLYSAIKGSEGVH